MRPIRELARRLRDGRLSAAALVETCLAVIGSRDQVLNAFITVLGDTARERAKLVDRELARGIDLGPLHGIPVSVKDLIDLEGVPTTAASRVRDGHRATTDAPVLARLRAAGAVFIGKTNLHEFAFGTTGDDSAYGATRNPHASDRMAGGSSSGSAVSVAAGMAVASIGTDTGGSIRIPAAACGVVGLKPTFAELSCEGVVPLGPSLDHVGPIGQTVDDIILVYKVMAGLDARGDPPRGNSTPGRLGVPRNYFLDVLDDDVRRQFDRTLERLDRTGLRLDEVDLPHAADVATTYLRTVLYEAVRVHQDTLAARPGAYSPEIRRRIQSGHSVSESEYREAQQTRKILGLEVDAALDGHDGLLLPTLAIPAPRLGTAEVTLAGATHAIRSLTLRLTQLFDLTGHPALSVPTGTTRDGLPCAIQLVGRRAQTLSLLELGARYEDVF